MTSQTSPLNGFTAKDFAGIAQNLPGVSKVEIDMDGRQYDMYEKAGRPRVITPSGDHEFSESQVRSYCDQLELDCQDFGLEPENDKN